MSRTSLAALIAAALTAWARPAPSQVLPDPPATQSITCTQNDPKLSERLKVLLKPFGEQAFSVPGDCRTSSSRFGADGAAAKRFAAEG